MERGFLIGNSGSYWEAIDSTPQADKEMYPMIILGLAFMASNIAFLLFLIAIVNSL